MVYLRHNENDSRKDFIMTDSSFAAELRDAARINELEDQRAEMLDAVQEANGVLIQDAPFAFMMHDDPDYWG